MQEQIKKLLSDSIRIKQEYLDEPKNIEVINRVVEKIINCYRNNNKVIVFGNGGSAADAQHFVAELVARFKKDRRALAAIALTTNTSTITALGNDYSFDIVFSRQIEALANKGDVVIGISTSGNSKNVIAAIQEAKKIGCLTVGMTSKTGGKLKEITDLCIGASTDDTPRVQEIHITVIHIICELVEKAIFP